MSILDYRIEQPFDTSHTRPFTTWISQESVLSILHYRAIFYPVLPIMSSPYNNLPTIIPTLVPLEVDANLPCLGDPFVEQLGTSTRSAVQSREEDARPKWADKLFCMCEPFVEQSGTRMRSAVQPG